MKNGPIISLQFDKPSKSGKHFKPLKNFCGLDQLYAIIVFSRKQVFIQIKNIICYYTYQIIKVSFLHGVQQASVLYSAPNRDVVQDRQSDPLNNKSVFSNHKNSSFGQNYFTLILL